MSIRPWRFFRLAATPAVVATIVCNAAPEALGGVEEPIYAIDSPTAGILGHREYHVRGRVGPQSSFLVAARLGLFHRIQVGVSFGVQHVFERDDVTANDHIGLQVRLRVLDEFITPAVAVGFDSQGTGVYDGALERYERKSPGFYGVLSKNWRVLLTDLSLHGGVNYSLETTDGDDELSAFGAAEWILIGGLSLVLDVNAALNDNTKDGRFGGDGGYLDGAVRLNYGESISLMLIFRDLSGNFETDREVSREFEFAFLGTL
jgi:hypothetical protein